MPKVKPEAFWQKMKIEMLNFEFPEALKKPLDLLYSNVRVAFLAPETRFWCSESGATKRDKSKSKKATKVRAVGKIGGTEAGVGRRGAV